MASKPIITRADVEARYRGAPEDFVPTHRVEVQDPRTKRILRWDLVRLEELEAEVSYAYGPFGEDLYGVLSTGLWQCFAIHGRIKVTPVRYKAEHTPLMEQEGLIYFTSAGDGGPIKIGWSQHLHQRTSNLQTANAHKLKVLGTVVGTRENEAAIHAHFAHLRMEGEWFENSPEIHEFIQNGTVNSLYEAPSR